MVIHIEKNNTKINVGSIVVDTNVLYWFFYGNTIYSSSAYQKKFYPNFLEKLIENKKCKIYTTVYNICELFNIIEKNEYEIYLKRNNLTKDNFSKKEFRKLKEERIKIKKTMQLIYEQIKNCIKIEESNIDLKIIEEFQEDFENHNYDMFDFIIVEYCKENNVNYILTDDIDFSNSSFNNINIITANKRLV